MGMALFSTMLTQLAPYYLWFVTLAFLAQLYDTVASREYVDVAVLLILLVPLLVLLGFLALPQYAVTLVWALALALQLYDVYQS